jgi:hypothetical protein
MYKEEGMKRILIIRREVGYNYSGVSSKDTELYKILCEHKNATQRNIFIVINSKMALNG